MAASAARATLAVMEAVDAPDLARLRGQYLRDKLSPLPSVRAVRGLGLLLGVAGGRWAWTSFASSIGVVPVTEVPLAALAGGLVALVVLASVLSVGPAMVAAGTAIDSALRGE